MATKSAERQIDVTDPKHDTYKLERENKITKSKALETKQSVAWVPWIPPKFAGLKSENDHSI